MIFNEIISLLEIWCRKKAEFYVEEYQNHGGLNYIGYIMADDLEFKLSMLIDKSFENKDGLQDEIFNLLSVYLESKTDDQQEKEAQHIMEKISKEFCEYAEELFSQKETPAMPDIPYYRVIVGEEADGLINRFQEIWRYDNRKCWYPLTDTEPKEISDKFFIVFDYLEPYMKKLEKLIGLPKTHIYGYGEAGHCVETAEIIEFAGGRECIYTDKDFSWAIYFSHENTVTFAGSIVPQAKKLLKNEKAHWNQFEWNFN